MTEVERWKGLCRKVTGALNKRSADYEESQRELVSAHNELACKCAEVDGLEWQVEELEEENARLRDELAKARDPQRIGGQADPSSFVYAIEQLREFRWQHATNDEDAIPYINNVAAAHERENAKLRELVRDAWGSGHPDRSCEGCDIRDECHDDTERLRKDGMLRFSRCLFELRIEDRMRELGIEVD